MECDHDAVVERTARAILEHGLIVAVIEDVAWPEDDDTEKIVAAIRRLAEMGEIEWRWDREGREAVSFTTYGAKIRGVKPDQWSSRWVPISACERSPTRASAWHSRPWTDEENRQVREFTVENFDEYIDPDALEPLDYLIETEETERVARRRRTPSLDPARLPWPTHLIAGVRTWPIPGQVKDDGDRMPQDAPTADPRPKTRGRPRKPPEPPCGACRGRKLGASEYCLVCDRWGLDNLLPKRRMPPDTSPDKPEVKVKENPDPKPTGLKGGCEGIPRARDRNRRNRNIS